MVFQTRQTWKQGLWEHCCSTDTTFLHNKHNTVATSLMFQLLSSLLLLFWAHFDVNEAVFFYICWLEVVNELSESTPFHPRQISGKWHCFNTRVKTVTQKNSSQLKMALYKCLVTSLDSDCHIRLFFFSPLWHNWNINPPPKKTKIETECYKQTLAVGNMVFFKSASSGW